MKATLDKSKKTILFYHPDRYSSTNARRASAREADAYFEQHVPCNFLVALTWEDFVAKLDLKPELVGFHADMFNHEEFKISELITTIKATLKLKNILAKISVTVTKDTSLSTVHKLKKSGIAGIQLGRIDYGIDSATESWRELLNNDSYWPDDFISRLSTTTKPLHIYFRDDSDSEVALQLKKQIMKGVVDVNVRHCKSFSELSDALHDEPASISFHIDMVRRHGGTISEFMMMLETMMKYNNLTVNPTICVAIEADTHVSTIKELQKHKIFSIIPGASTIGVEYTRTAIKDIINKIPHWPKDIISRLPGNENKIKNKTSHSLTGRQQEVFDLIANRGLSNKQIARVLNISESTVKIHVSAVMKNLCVRNRTQLALTK